MKTSGAAVVARSARSQTRVMSDGDGVRIRHPILRLTRALGRALPVILAGCAPLFWMPPGYLAKTEDFVWPITFERWLGYFSLWHPAVGFGASPDDRLPAAFFMFWPAALRGLGFSMEAAQRLQMTLWFLAGGLAMYWLMSRLVRAHAARTAAALVYLFNFYQEPVWQGMNIANLSAYVGLPLLLAIAIGAVRGGHIGRSATAFALATVVL
jgi:hypothetical protein